MNIQNIHLMYEYNYWANGKILSAAAKITEEQAMRAYINGLTDEDMNSHIKYTTDEGIHRDRILWHCLYHLVNHGTQHRSEAAAMLTSYGASPGELDFTLFLNENSA